MAKNEDTNFVKAATALKLRLREPLMWYPVPALISFGLVTVLTARLLPGLNPRLGNPANIIMLDAENELEGSIWLSLSAQDDRLIITTSDRRVYTIDTPIESSDQLEDFVTYLKNSAKSRIETAVLSRTITATETTAVLAVGQTLRYVHIKPVLQALAEAGITDYAFETKMVISQKDQTNEGMEQDG